MPLETITGPNIPALLAEAQARIGEDAVVLSVRRMDANLKVSFELVAADPTTATMWSASAIASALLPAAIRTTPVAPPVQINQNGRGIVIALVGPTGAGKTTTIAKLANHPGAFGGRTVGVICLDTYRIGAIEQLKIFADLSRVPLEVVYETNEIPRAKRRLRDCELILVDTPGRGPRGQADAEATQKQLSWLKPDEVHLVAPAGLQAQRIRRMIESHRAYGITHMLVTKLDEYPEDEAIFRFATECKLPIRWVANGQGVPDDLEIRSVVPIGVPALSTETAS